MREIKCRGKCSEDNQWYYGSRLELENGTVFIIPTPRSVYDVQGDAEWVDPATVGQFTGLRDEKGAEIYEGDILMLTSELPHSRVKVEWGGRWEICGFTLTGIVKGANGFVDFSDDPLNVRWGGKYVEIIGNIHDNPELLAEQA
jgi:uncharacterized phage protein (TIGR01671 family)